MSPLTQRNPVFGQLSLAEEAVIVPSWQRVWNIRNNFLDWGAFLLCRATWYPSGIWNKHSLPPENFHSMKHHWAPQHNRWPQMPLSHLSFHSPQWRLPSLCVSLGLLLGVLASLGEAHFVFLPHIHTHKDLQDGCCQHISWSLQLWFVTLSRFSLAQKTVWSFQIEKKLPNLCFIY